VSSGNCIKVRANGPLLCTGDIEVYTADGGLLEKSADLALCRCGHSGNKPFCDGSHREAGFEHDGMMTALKSDEPDDAGGSAVLRISLRQNAMLIASGPMSILRADGSCAATRNKAALCRCGHSGNKPFCDGSHKACGFEG
jgi:CDGSH-type Zn-finger protein